MKKEDEQNPKTARTHKSPRIEELAEFPLAALEAVLLMLEQNAKT